MIWGLNSPVRPGDRGAKPPESRAVALMLVVVVVVVVVCVCVCVFFEYIHTIPILYCREE